MVNLLTFDSRLLILGVQSIYSDFSETTWPVKLKFHMKTPYDRLANIDTNCSDHMTKSATMPV